ncbi:SIMPL domain-containing protein [Oleiharenicola lentus]|uniref:SIMPL domain-containing protein n=1 Tax=Oleiharenicola lentus TaxID=2508720 RepID=UPI003F67F2F8
MNASLPARPHLFGLLAGLALAAALAFAALVVARAWTRIAESQVVNVTGSARKNVRSDLVVWRASFSVDASTLLGAQEKLQIDLAKVSAFLTSRGLTEFSTAPVQIREITSRQRDEDDGTTSSVRVGYRLVQSLEVRSAEVDRVPKLASDTGELLQADVLFVSEGFEFIYTQANEAKVEMMAEATKDARTRADQIAQQGDRAIKELRNARQGVVQINPLYSTATSWEGNNDTSSIEKTITATISATFALK